MATSSLPSPEAPRGPEVRPPHPLREGNFRLWLTGSAISLLGDQCYLVALPWLVLQKTGSAVAMGTILMAAAIPRAVLMLMGGAVSDRISPRRIMMGTATLRTLFVAAIGFLVWFDSLRLWELYALGFAFGVADAFALPASQAFLPSLVKREQLVAANSVLQTMVGLTSVAGPAPAGVMIKALGIAWAFFLDAISFLFIIGALWRLPDPPAAQTSAPRKAVWHAIVEGIQYVGKDVSLRSLMAVATVINFCIVGPIGVGLPYLAKTRFGSATAYGTMLSAAAVGGLLGTLLAGVWRVRRRGVLILLASLIIGVCVGLLGLFDRLWMAAGITFLMGATSGLSNVNLIAWIQQRIEPLMRGRVMSVLMLAGFGLMPVSLAAGGVLVAWNLRWTLLFAGGAMVTVVAFASLQKTVRQIE